MIFGRRRPRLLPAFVGVLVGVLLAGTVFALDRYAARRAEDAAAREVAVALQTPTPPLVYLRGFPFLTQRLTGRFGEVRVVAADALLPGTVSRPVRGLDLVLFDVTAEDRYASVRAARVEGTAVLDYAALPRIGGQPITYAGAGRVHVDLLPRLAGVPLEATVVGWPVLDVAAQTITLSRPRILVAGVRVNEESARSILRSALRPLPLTNVLFGLRVTSLSVDDTGVQLGLAGENVVLRG